MINPDDFVITRRRKKYKFAHFANLENCFEAAEWKQPQFDKPLVVELGAGTANFSVELARRHPEIQYVAIDVKADRLQTGARRAVEEGVENVSFVRAHADQLAELFGQHTVSQIWLTFSDPFPKKRHAKHRLTHPRFLGTYRELLADSGRLHMKTDNHVLFNWSLEQLVREKWELEQLTYDLHESDMPDDARITTTFESRFVAEGLPIFFLTATVK